MKIGPLNLIQLSTAGAWRARHAWGRTRGSAQRRARLIGLVALVGAASLACSDESAPAEQGAREQSPAPAPDFRLSGRDRRPLPPALDRALPPQRDQAPLPRPRDHGGIDQRLRDAALTSERGATDLSSPVQDALLPPEDLRPPPPSPAAGYCERSVSLFCPFYLRCGWIVAEDLDECEATFLEACEAVYEPRYRALEEAGHLALNPRGEVWRRCAEHLSAVSCGAQLNDLDGPCGDLWVGLQPAGGSCGPGIESLVCASGSACRVDLSLCGRCEEVLPRGAACTAGEGPRCAPEAYCDAGEGRCLARGAPGAPCDETSDCLLGAYCIEDRCAVAARAGVGEPCDRLNRCPYRSECLAGRCVASALLGEECGAERRCASGWCAGGRCAPFTAAGAPCQSGQSCASGRCDGGLCAPLISACFE